MQRCWHNFNADEKIPPFGGIFYRESVCVAPAVRKYLRGGENSASIVGIRKKSDEKRIITGIGGAWLYKPGV